MKPIFGVDITENKNNETISGEKFIIKKVDSDISQRLEASEEETDEIVEKRKLPLALRIVFGITFFAGFILLISLIDGSSEVGLLQAYNNVPYLFWICGICLVISAVLFVMAKIKSKKVMENEETQNAMQSYENRLNATYDDLGVPQNARNVDVLLFFYKWKDGECVVKSKGFSMTKYVNLDLKIFAKDDKIYLADTESLYCFDKSSVKSIKTINKKISIPSWNKEESPKSGIYKQYKMIINQYEMIFFKPYHILEIEQDGEVWGIHFPCYDLPIFEQITGLKAEEKQSH